MNNFDDIIKKACKREIEENLDYENMIKKAINSNSYKIPFFNKVAVLILSLVMSGTVVLATTYVVYEKIWKEPSEYNNYEEFLKNDKFASHNVDNNIEIKNEVDNNYILEESNKLLSNLNYKDITITLEDIKKETESDSSKYLIDKDNLNIIYNLNGEIQSFVDYNNDNKYDIEADNILKDEAILYANKIKDSLNLNSDFKLKEIQEISSLFENKEKKIWYVRFNKFDNGIINNYQNLDIYYYINNSNIVIEKILMFDDIRTFGYKYDNNEIIISKDLAIETALEKDRELTDLEVKEIQAELSINDINAFIYAQELTNGIDDEMVYTETSNGERTAYNKYVSEYILRNVWEVQIVYTINSDSKEKIKTWKENFGRNYYIDATTGEIIGGAWGEKWHLSEE